jgi:hypothetical protein
MKLVETIARERKSLRLILLVYLFLIFLYGEIPYTQDPYNHWDLHDYIKIAQAAPNFDSSVLEPFAFRFLPNYLIGLLPFDKITSFHITTLILSYILLITMYLFLVSQGISRKSALFSLVCFGLNEALFGMTLWNFFSINELLTYILLIILLYYIINFKWLIFGVLLFISTLSRETNLILIFVALAYIIEKKRLNSDFSTLLYASIPAVFLEIALRIYVPYTAELGLFGAFSSWIKEYSDLELWFRVFINTFTPLSFLPIIFILTSLRFFADKKYLLIFIILIFLSKFFGCTVERLLYPIFIVFYWLFAYILDKYSIYGKKEGFYLLIACFFSSFNHFIARFPLPNEYWTYSISIFFFLFISIVFFFKYGVKEFKELKSLRSYGD